MWGVQHKNGPQKHLNLKVWTFTSSRRRAKSDLSTNMTGLEVSWWQSSQHVHKIRRTKNNTGRETSAIWKNTWQTSKSFKFISKKTFRLIHTTVGTCVLSWEHLLTKTNAQYQVIQSDLFIPWLEVTEPLKGSRFHHPKKVTSRIARYNLWEKKMPGTTTVLRSWSRSRSWWLAHAFGYRSLAL